eukprot:748309-Hanusia_phi.AAC.12
MEKFPLVSGGGGLEGERMSKLSSCLKKTRLELCNASLRPVGPRNCPPPRRHCDLRRCVRDADKHIDAYKAREM